jgi:hypothetical protein
MRSASGQFSTYNISNNDITAANNSGAVGPDWQLGGFAVDPPTGDSSVGQLVQAMAGFGGSSGATDSLNAAHLGAEASQQSLLTTPQHA